MRKINLVLIQLIQPPFENVLQHLREQKHAKLHDESTSVPNGKKQYLPYRKNLLRPNR